VADDELRRFTEDVGSPPGRYGGYRGRLLVVCLVQGGAQHFIDTRLGVSPDHHIEVCQVTIDKKGYVVTNEGRVISGLKDIDICLFFRHDPVVPIPVRNHCLKSVYATLSPELGERKFDFMKKGVQESVALGANNATGIMRHYIASTAHGRNFLAKKSIVGLGPSSVFAKPLWVTHRWTEGRLPAQDTRRRD